MDRLSALTFYSSPFIVLTLYVVCIFSRAHFVFFLSVYAIVVFAFFILFVYVFRLIEMELYLCLLSSHLPSSLVVADKFNGESPLWFYHLVCQVFNGCTLLLIRMILK